VRARGSRVGVVEDVVLDPARGTASALVLSSRFLHRRRVVLARTVEAVDPEARVFELEVKARSPQPSRLARFIRWSAPRVHALALATWRLMRKYGHDAYESCRTGRVREAARGARGGAERAASWVPARGPRRLPGRARSASEVSDSGRLRYHVVWGRTCSAGEATCSSTGSREPKASACAPAGRTSASSKASCSIQRSARPPRSSSALGSCIAGASCWREGSRPSIPKPACSSSRWKSVRRGRRAPSRWRAPRPGSRRECGHSLWRSGGS